TIFQRGMSQHCEHEETGEPERSDGGNCEPWQRGWFARAAGAGDHVVEMRHEERELLFRGHTGANRGLELGRFLHPPTQEPQLFRTKFAGELLLHELEEFGVGHAVGSRWDSRRVSNEAILVVRVRAWQPATRECAKWLSRGRL